MNENITQAAWKTTIFPVHCASTNTSKQPRLMLPLRSCGVTRVIYEAQAEASHTNTRCQSVACRGHEIVVTAGGQKSVSYLDDLRSGWYAVAIG